MFYILMNVSLFILWRLSMTSHVIWKKIRFRDLSYIKKWSLLILKFKIMAEVHLTRFVIFKPSLWSRLLKNKLINYIFKTCIRKDELIKVQYESIDSLKSLSFCQDKYAQVINMYISHCFINPWNELDYTINKFTHMSPYIYCFAPHVY